MDIFCVSFSNFLSRALDTPFLYSENSIREETLHQEDKGHIREVGNEYMGRIPAVVLIDCFSKNELSNILHLKQSSRTCCLLLMPPPITK